MAKYTKLLLTVLLQNSITIVEKSFQSLHEPNCKVQPISNPKYTIELLHYKNDLKYPTYDRSIKVYRAKLKNWGFIYLLQSWNSNLEDRAVVKLVEVYYEVETEGKEVSTYEASQTEGTSLQGLNLVALEGILKDVLFHEQLIFIAIYYSAFLKLLKNKTVSAAYKYNGVCKELAKVLYNFTEY